MDLSTPERKPLSKAFYNDITKDIPSPISKDFYDAISKPVEEKSSPVTSSRSEVSRPLLRPAGSEEDTWLGGAGKSILSSGYRMAQSLAGAVRWGEEQSVESLARTPFEIASIAAKPVDWARTAITGVPDKKGEVPSEMISEAGKKVLSFLPDIARKPIIGSAEKAIGIEQPIGETAGDIYNELATEAAPVTKKGSFKYHVLGALQSAVGSIGAALVGMVTKNPELALNMFFLNAAGTEYDEQRRAGTDPARAAGAAMISGTAEKYTEKLPFETMLKQGQTFLTRMIKSTALDIPGELLATTFQEGLVKKATTNPNLTASDYWDAIKDTAIQTAITGPMQTGAIHPVVRYVENQQIKSIQNEVNGKGFGSRSGGDVFAMYQDVENLKESRPKDAKLNELTAKLQESLKEKNIDVEATKLYRDALSIDQKISNGEPIDPKEVKRITDGLASKGMAVEELEGSHEISKMFATLGSLDGAKERDGKLSPENQQIYNETTSRLNNALQAMKEESDKPSPEYAAGADGLVYNKKSNVAASESTGAEKGGIVKKPVEPAKSAAREVLTEGEPEARRKNMTAKDILTEGDINIQSEEDLTPEALAAIDKKVDENNASNDQQPYEKEAKEIGVTYQGSSKKLNGEKIPIFLDPETNMTFSLNENESIKDALSRTRSELEEVMQTENIEQEGSAVLKTPQAENLITKKEKAFQEYKDYISSLTDKQKAQITDLLEEKPKNAGMQKLKIEKALSALTEKPENQATVTRTPLKAKENAQTSSESVINPRLAPTRTSLKPATVSPKEVLQKSEIGKRAQEQYKGWKGKEPQAPKNDKREKAIARYIEYSTPFSGSPEAAAKRAQSWVDAIENKDVVTLRNMMNGGNPEVNRLFSSLTGLPAKTQKETDDSIRSLDKEKWDKWQSDKKTERRAEVARQEKDRKEKEENNILDEKVLYNKKEMMTRREIYQRNIDEGATKIEQLKRGAVSESWLINTEKGTRLKVPRAAVEYVQGLIDTKKTTVTEDLTKKSTGDLVNDIFSIINDHIGNRGSISNEVKLDESLYQKLKPYLQEIIRRAKEKALDAKAYLLGAVDSMEEGPAKSLYEQAADRYVGEGEKAKEPEPVILDVIESPGLQYQRFVEELTDEEKDMAGGYLVDAPRNPKLQMSRIKEAIQEAKDRKTTKNDSLTYEEFAKQYREAFQKSNKYTPDQVGSGHFVEEMAMLADKYPEYLERFEAETEKDLTKTEGVSTIIEKPVIKAKKGDEENAVRIREAKRQVSNDTTSPERQGPENLQGTEVGGELEELREKPGGGNDGELPGSMRGSNTSALLEGDGLRPEGPRNNNGPEPSLASSNGDVAGVQRPESRDYRLTPEAIERKGSWKETASRNLDIVQLVKQLETENRLATPEEQALLAKFTGWGASEIRNNIFPGYAKYGRIHKSMTDESWRPLVDRLTELFTDEDIKTAARSSQYAHYTSGKVVQSIWTGLHRMGFTGGKVFEPGMGVGVFAGLMPDSIYKQSSYTGIEFENFTAAIAKQLYQNQNVIHGDFTKQKFPNDFFDVAIGNPPFSQTKILSDPKYKKYSFSLHDYFFAKTIDKVRPGGLLAFVTSRYTMDKVADKARKYIADRADLVGAIRLPQTAFKENAGTEVVTDILFLRKRSSEEVAGGHPWGALADVKIGEDSKLINEYFVAHPEMVLGEHSTEGRQYSKNEYTVILKEGNIEDHFAKAIENLPENIYSITKKNPQEQQQAVIERDYNPKNKKEGGIYLSDNKELMIVSNGSGVPLKSERKITPNQEKWLKSYIPLRDVLKQSRYDQLTNGDWENSLKDLNAAYDKFTKKHGKILSFTLSEKTELDEDGNKTKIEYRRFTHEKTALLDVEGPLVLALENISEDGKITSSHALTQRTIKKPERGEIKTVGDAVAWGLNDKGSFDLDYTSGLLKQTKEETISQLEDLIYDNPSGTWELSDAYLSGDVISKLEEAEAAAKIDRKYLRNVEALSKVQPKPLSPKDITIGLGANWISTEHIRDFAQEVLDINADIKYREAANYWRVDFATDTSGWRTKKAPKRQSMRDASSSWGTEDRGANEILESLLNKKKIVVKRTVDEGGSKRTYTDEAATTAINEIAEKIEGRFESWIWEDVERADNILKTYNRKFNNIAPRTFNGDHLELPGLSLKYKLHKHQKRAIWRVIQTGNTYLAHAVGAGKTLESICAGMEMRRLGMVNKPMYIVPNHMLGQFSGEFMDAYPLANIMVATEDNFHTSNRRKFIAQAAINDPDAIILTHSSFGLLKMKQENVNAVKGGMVDDLRAALADLEEEKANRFLIRNMEQRIEALEQKFDSMVNSDRGDNVIDFEDLGADFLIADEAHMFRKLDFSTNQQIKGIDSNGSAMALGLYLKTKWLESKNPGRSHVYMSGTPVTNTMGELYTIMRFFDEERMREDGLRSFDSWSSMFGRVATDYEPNAAGGYEPVKRFSKFVNIPELSKRVREFMDVLTSDELSGFVKIPKIKGGGPQNIVVDSSPELAEYKKKVLTPRLQTSRAWKPSPGQKGNPDPVINIITDARLASIDMRFVDPGLMNDKNSKLNRMVDEIISDYGKLKDIDYKDDNGNIEPIKGGAQAVFYNHGFGKAVGEKRGFNSKKFVTDRLRAAGLPRNEIAWIDDYDTATKKAALFKEVRVGTKKIIIGSAKKMGTGMNIQKRLAVLDYLDPPWYPSDVEQPHGRILRQGNQNETVNIKWFATKDTYDSTMWQMVARKSRFIEQFFRGDDSIRSMEDISEISQYEMARALSSGDERIIKQVQLEADVRKLQKLKEAHAQQQATLRNDKAVNESTERYLNERIKAYEIAVEKTGNYTREFTAKIGKTDGITKKSDLGKAVVSAYNKITPTIRESGEKEYGTVNGISLIVKSELHSEGVKLTNILQVTPNVAMVIDRGFSYPAGTDENGLGQRIINRINEVPDKLREFKGKLGDAKANLQKINRKLGAPYEHERELLEKTNELHQLIDDLLAEGQAAENAETPAEQEPGPDEMSLRMSSAENKSGLDALKLNLDIGEQIAKWNNAPEIQVWQSQEEFLNSLSSTIQKTPLMQAARKGKIRGAHQNGKVHLIADNLKDFDTAVEIVLHETIGHYGLRGLFLNKKDNTFAPEFKQLLLDIAKDKESEVTKIANAYQFNMSTEEGRLKAAEEWLARAAETRAKNIWVLKLKALIKDLLQKLGIDKDLDAKVDSILAASAKFVESGKRTAAGEMYSHDMSYSMAPKPLGVEEAQAFLSGEPITSITGKEFAKSDQRLSDMVADWYLKHHKGKVTNPIIGDVMLDNRGVKDSIGHGIGRVKAAAFALVPDVISKGKIIQYSDNWQGRNIEGFVLAAPVKIGGDHHVGVVVVRKSRELQRFYLHEVYLTKKLQEPFKTGAFPLEEGREAGGPGAISKLLYNIFKVKPEAQFSIQTDQIDSKSLFPEVNERLKEAKGIQYASLKDRVRDTLVTGWEHFTRHFPYLDPKTDGAVIDVLRRFQDVPSWAKDETVQKLSSFIGKLSPQERDVFTMNILFPDIIRDIENGTYSVDDEGGLPFGYKNRDQVQQDHDHFKAIAEDNPAIKEAIEKRNAFMSSLTEQLIKHKLLKKEAANDPSAYFHHQVLAYMNYKKNPNWGMSSQDVRTHRKGWQIGRKGSQLDYNTEYVESEFEVISQALTQIETVKSLKEIERLADKKPELENKAKAENMKTFYRKLDEQGLLGVEDPLKPFRTKIAVGMAKITDLVKKGKLYVPMQFDDVLNFIQEQAESMKAAKKDKMDFSPQMHPQMFPLLNYLVNHQSEGTMPAAMIFKAIGERNKYIKDVVGKDWVTYNNFIEEGYVTHKPDAKSTFYFANSIADQAIEQVMAGNKLLPDAIKQVLARGRDAEWVIKEGISKTLNGFRPAMSDSLPAKISKDVMTTWKQWILMNPFRVIKRIFPLIYYAYMV